MVGMFRRIAAISMPGVILSQLEMRHQRVGAVGIDHIFDGVGNQIGGWAGNTAYRQVSHSDAVDGDDGVEFFGDGAPPFRFRA